MDDENPVVKIVDEVHEHRQQAHDRALKIVQGFRDGSLLVDSEDGDGSSRTLEGKFVNPMLRQLFATVGDDEMLVTFIFTFIGEWLKQYEGPTTVLGKIVGVPE